MDFVEKIKQDFKKGSTLTKLIYINAILFLALKLFDLFFSFSGQYNFFTKWLAVPSSFQQLIFKPWTPFTYMFLHWNFIHLIFNLIGLYWFGKLFLRRFEGQKLLSVYVLGGLSGAAFYVLAYTLVPGLQVSSALLLGASASVIALLVAVAVYEPHTKIRLVFIGDVELQYIAIFYVLISILGVSGTNVGGNLAHLGGAFWGWFFIYQLGKGKDMGAWMPNFLEKIPDLFGRKRKMKVTHKAPPKTDYEYNRQKNNQQDEINRILEKISKSGYDSLTKEEKTTLFKQRK